jgi:PIN domain nuclease of toxin-antitoxin system
MGTVAYLLDTHTFLWAVRGSSRLSDEVVGVIEDINSKIFVSAVSAYEIMNKHRIGKLLEFDDVAKSYFEFIKKLDVILLPISAERAYFAGSFEWEHRDPFDRILAAQASIDDLTLITNDEAFDSLPWVKVMW